MVVDQNDFNLLLSTIEGDVDVMPSTGAMVELVASGAAAVLGDAELRSQRQGEFVGSELGVVGGWCS
jgi:hypothetical protein